MNVILHKKKGYNAKTIDEVKAAVKDALASN